MPAKFLCMSMCRSSTGKSFGQQRIPVNHKNCPLPTTDGIFPPIQNVMKHHRKAEIALFPGRQSYCNGCLCIRPVQENRAGTVDTFYRTYIVRPYIIFFIRAAVIPIRFTTITSCVATKFAMLSPLFSSLYQNPRIITASEIPLRPAMIKIDHRIPFLRSIKIAGR